MNWENLKGKFIVLDGPDGCGKSTQIKLLAEWLGQKGVECVTVRDPGGTVIGDQIREILLNETNKEMSVRCETLLFMASRAQLYSQKIKPAQEQGKSVLCDRWISSTYAYQAVAGKIGVDLVLQIAEITLDETWPDITIIFDLESKDGLERLGKKGGRNKRKSSDLNQSKFDFYQIPDRMEQKTLNFHNKVHKAFLELARGRADFRVVEGSGSIEEVQERVRKVLAEYVNT